MEIFFKKYMKNSIFISILLIIFAIFLFFKPINSVNFIMILLGMIVLVNGFIHTVSYFTTSKELRTYSFELLEGILCMIIGLFFVLEPKIVISFLPLIIGIWIITGSILKIQLSLNLKSIENKDWLILLIIAIITLIIGIVMILNPFRTAIAITSFAGLILLISEVINLTEAFFILKKI